MLNRKPIAAGRLYPSSFDRLENQIKVCFLDKNGPGDFPVSRTNKKKIGVIAPSSSYSESGAISAWSFKELGEIKLPKAYIILGNNDTNLGGEISVFTFTNWETPFGVVNINKENGSKLARSFNKIINEAEPFLENKTIEVQLPFLQYVSRDYFRELSFVPIIIKSINYDELMKLASAVATIKNDDYFNLMVSSNIIGDEEALGFIKNLNSNEYYNYLVKNNLMKKEASPLIVGIECAKLLGARRARLLNYCNGNKENIIYGAFAFE